MKTKHLIICLIVLLSFVFLIPYINAITGSIGNARILINADVGDSIEKYILVRNINNVEVNIQLSASGDLSEDIDILDKEFILAPGEEKKVYFTIDIKEEGTTESYIDVEFIPLTGESVGLKSTITVIAFESSSMIKEIIHPKQDMVLKQDSIILSLKTIDDVSCSYEYRYCAVNENNETIPSTCTDFSSEEMLISENLSEEGLIHADRTKDSYSEDYGNYLYELSVTCEDEFDNEETKSLNFYVDLSDIRENLIIRDISDFNYLYSMYLDSSEIVGESIEDLKGIYYSLYETNNEEDNYNSMIAILDFENQEKLKDFLMNEDNYIEEDIEGHASLMMIDNGNYIITFESETINFYAWTNENRIIFVYLSSEEDSYSLFFPEELINAYTEKYPNDLPDYLIKPFSDYGKDLDNDTLYDFLTIKLNVTVPEDGNYKVLGRLTDEDFNKITDTEKDMYLHEGINTIELNFNGVDILNSNKNGPYYFNNVGIIGINNDFNLGLDDTIYLTLDYDYNSFDLVTQDINPPNIQLISPSDDYSTKSKSINFRYIPDDDSDIVKCELIIDNKIEERDNNILKGAENVFEKHLSRDNYKWKIICIDIYGNQRFSEERDLKIKKSSSGSSDDSSTLIIDASSKDSSNKLPSDNLIEDEDNTIILNNPIVTSDNSRLTGAVIWENTSKGTFIVFLLSLIILIIILFLIIFVHIYY